MPDALSWRHAKVGAQLPLPDTRVTLSDPDLSPSDLQSIIDASPDCIKVLDLDGRLLSINTGGLKTMEIGNFNACRNQPWQSFWEGEGQAQVEQAVQTARAGQTSTFEGPAKTFAGTPRWWEVRVSPVRNSAGTVTRLLATSRDITAQKDAELILKNSEQQSRHQAGIFSLQASQNEQALEAFVRFSEAAGQITDLGELTQLAMRTLQTLIPGANMAFTLRTPTHWQLLYSTDNLDPALLMMAKQQGFPLDTPVFAELVRTGEPSFIAGWDEDTQEVAHSGQFQSVAHYPITQSGQVIAALGLAVTDQQGWLPLQQAIIRSVGRSFTLLYERVAAAQALKQHNLALQAANEELEAFNYSVSHDLMTPVRHVAGFAQLAEQNLKNPEKATHYLDIVQQGAKRMDSLIQAMLTLSRTGRQALSIGVVDLGALVEQVRLALAPEVAARAIEWRVASLPMARGDRVMLEQVMSNLLENAVKYSAGKNPAIIEVWSEESERDWTVFVRDNGAGFDPRYKDKLFGIFQRLHRQDEFPGTGVGLALVRRIIARHDGTVSAKGEVGTGATVSFSLPKQTA